VRRHVRSRTMSGSVGSALDSTLLTDFVEEVDE
jgi:hypothetical protein